MARYRSNITCTPIDGGKATDGEFVHCCHCGKGHYVGGSIRTEDLAARLAKLERDLAYCAKCNSVCCAPGCLECVPVERKRDNVAAGRPVDSRLIIG